MPNQWVVPNSERGGWDQKAEGAERATKHFETKAEAVQAARQTARDQGSELIVCNQDGRIARRDSHGKDPCPPRG